MVGIYLLDEEIASPFCRFKRNKSVVIALFIRNDAMRELQWPKRPSSLLYSCKGLIFDRVAGFEVFCLCVECIASFGCQVEETRNVDAKGLQERYHSTGTFNAPVGETGASMRRPDGRDRRDKVIHLMLVNHVTSIKSTHAVGDDVDFSAVFEVVRQPEQLSLELIGSKIHACRPTHLGVPNLESGGHKCTSNPLEVVPAVIVLVIEAERLVQKLVKTADSVGKHDGKIVTPCHRYTPTATRLNHGTRLIFYPQ